MSQELPRKRTRSEMVGKDLLQDEDQHVRKKEIVEGGAGVEIRDVPIQSTNPSQIENKAKLLKKKLRQLEDSKMVEQETDTKNQDANEKGHQKKQKHKKKKSKHNDKQDEERKGEEKQLHSKKKDKKGQQKEDEEIKQQEQMNEKLKSNSKQQKNTNKSREKDRSQSKKKSKKMKTKEKDRKKQKQLYNEKDNKKAEPQQQDAKEEQKSQKESLKQSRIQRQKKHKKKKKEQSEPEQQQQEQEQKQEQQQDEEEESDSEQDESGKKKTKKSKKIGRRPSGPVKRKKTSIFEQQQIINKKYRVKKKSHYLNKMSNRAWGPMRAGPYRQVPKPSKDEQRKIIDTLLGDGPKNQNASQSALEDKIKENSSVKLEADQHPNTQDQEKMEEEQIQIKKSKNKKKKKESQSEEERPKSKQKSKSKSKKKSKKKDESDDEKEKDQTKSTIAKTKKSKSDGQSVKQESQTAKSTKNKKKKVDKPQVDSQDEAKLQQDGQKKTTSKNKKKRKHSDSQQSSSSEKVKSKSKSKKKAKQDVKYEGNKKPRLKATKQQDHQFSKQDSEKVIGLFAVDGGNYPQMMKQLPGIRLKKVRLHLRMLFHRALDIITYQVQHRCGRKIKEWEQDEKVEIVRELHRIRSSNRLLSQANVHFREKMTALMRSYHDESWLDTVSETDIETLYRRLEAFVRGYNTINRSKRTSAASMTEIKIKEKEQRYKFSKEVTRKPIICGGHLLSKGVKNEYKEEQDPSQIEERSRSIVAPEKLVEDWNRQEEKTLCELYVSNQEADETICDRLKQKYGPSPKWRDFELLGRKIDQLIKFALIKLQNLTARPYCRLERVRQLQRKRAKLELKLKKEHDSQRLTTYYKQKLRTTSMFLYDNQIFQKEERLQMKQRIFKNLSLLQRQIFGHIESYKVKTALVRVLIEQFPPEEEVEQAVREAKRFSRWAREQQRRNNISSIKNIFVGQREDSIYREDDPNEDSIMVDVDKVEITRKNGVEQEERNSEEGGDEKSVLFVGGGYGGANEPIEIQNDGAVQVSDFEEPQSVHSSVDGIQEVEAPVEPQFKMLQKLYQTLNTNRPK